MESKSNAKVVELVAHLVALRKQQGLTQVEVAKRMGLTQPAISWVEQPNKHALRMTTILRYAEAIGYDVHVTIVPRYTDDHTSRVIFATEADRGKQA